MGHRFPRRGHRQAPRLARRRLQALPVQDHHELHQGLPEGAQPGQGDREDQAERRGGAGDLKRVKSDVAAVVFFLYILSSIVFLIFFFLVPVLFFISREKERRSVVCSGGREKVNQNQ